MSEWKRIYEHPNQAVVEELYAAFESKDAAALKNLIATDAVWHIPGSSLISGDHRGHAEIFAYFEKLQELTGGTFSAELIDVLASDMQAAALAAAKGTRGDRVYEQTYLLLLRIHQDPILQARLLHDAKEAFPALWS